MAPGISSLLAAALLLAWPGLCLAAGAAAFHFRASADHVKHLPEYGDLEPLRMFAGYLNVSEDSGADRRVFYCFTESERDPQQDPLVLWLQGGPGCSPVGTGGFKLLGPFFLRPDYDNTSSLELMRNNASWTRVASLLFLDTPLFTGFSSSSDNVTDRFWGHYIPLLAQAILDYNDNLPDGGQRLNLQGYAVGNPWTDPTLDNEGAVEVWYSDYMVSRDTYDGLKQHCNMSSVVLWRTDGESGVEGECAKYRDAALRKMGGYDEYGVPGPKCQLGPDGNPLLVQPPYEDLPSPTFDPCAAQRVKAYFNRADVQEALHAIQPGEPPLPWKACNSRGITYSYDSLATSMLPVHRKLLDAGVRALVFSGDGDGVVPSRSTRSWVEGLGLPPAGEFRPWRDAATNETAGYLMSYQGLKFASVHDAGHHVAYFKPAHALQMIAAFLDGRLP